MKFVTIFFFACAALVAVSALPALQFDEELDSALYVADHEAPFEKEGHYRLKRATCDILSFQSQWVTPNHAGCALHCVIKGYKGGRCKGTICHCRK
uniref:Defensin n=1 Tax=Locusta migratoria TaxID=7004 RepID=A0A1J0M1V2_LOCMI|nr:defensin [Locusta migratoria]